MAYSIEGLGEVDVYTISLKTGAKKSANVVIIQGKIGDDRPATCKPMLLGFHETLTAKTDVIKN